MHIPPAWDRAITVALEEDLSSGDVTTEACVPEDVRAVAHAVCREDIVVCGGALFARVFARVDPACEVDVHVRDGARATAGTRLWTVRGPARSVLMAERTALNLAQRACGVATLTRRTVDALASGSRTRITDTRKTTPGLRAIERYAVRVGGGHNHRDNLGSAVLIKDNHILAAGGIAGAVERARARAPHTTKIECEVTTLAELDQGLAARADILMLDNMSTELVREAVRRAAGRAVLEASGGVTLERVAELSATGVDAISIGALTRSAPAADIGLDFEP